mmetsp:Transcript_5820/g.18361  ORF Transcript_5820/g.18361 Transcript_5820/m.18361 type:complete len:336 (-) Transcript_5820:195-1202(-)
MEIGVGRGTHIRVAIIIFSFHATRHHRIHADIVLPIFLGQHVRIFHVIFPLRDDDFTARGRSTSPPVAVTSHRRFPFRHRRVPGSLYNRRAHSRVRRRSLSISSHAASTVSIGKRRNVAHSDEIRQLFNRQNVQRGHNLHHVLIRRRVFNGYPFRRSRRDVFLGRHPRPRRQNIFRLLRAFRIHKAVVVVTLVRINARRRERFRFQRVSTAHEQRSRQERLSGSAGIFFFPPQTFSSRAVLVDILVFHERVFSLSFLVLVFLFVFVFAHALSRAPGEQQGGGHPTVSRTRRRDDERVRCARYLLFLFVVHNIVVARVVMLFKSILLVVVILHRFL